MARIGVKKLLDNPSSDARIMEIGSARLYLREEIIRRVALRGREIASFQFDCRTRSLFDLTIGIVLYGQRIRIQILLVSSKNRSNYSISLFTRELMYSFCIRTFDHFSESIEKYFTIFTSLINFEFT